MTRVLVACEFTGVVRDAFAALGCDAVSCDLLESERPGPHYRGDVRDILNDGWDLMVAHPPCTYLCRAGARWWPGREVEQAEALDFVRALLAAPIPRIAVENPPGRIGTAIRPADQYVHPWWFGDPVRKMTGLWLKGLPLLTPTNDVSAAMKTLPKTVTDAIHYMTPRVDRRKERSRTFPGFAAAMAVQWTRYMEAEKWRDRRLNP